MTETIDFCINLFTVVVSASVAVSVGMIIISSAIVESKKMFSKRGNKR